MSAEPSIIALLQLLKRADQSEPEILLKTFVGTGMLEALLTSVDHQVIHGRRGTGKTHALQYLAESRRAKGDLPIYIDLRRIGSSTGIFSDDTIPLAERGTRLLRDILTSIHQQFLDFAIEGNDLNLSVVGSTLDAFIDAATHVEIVGGDSTEQSKSSLKARDEQQQGERRCDPFKVPIVNRSVRRLSGSNRSGGKYERYRRESAPPC